MSLVQQYQITGAACVVSVDQVASLPAIVESLRAAIQAYLGHGTPAPFMSTLLRVQPKAGATHVGVYDTLVDVLAAAKISRDEQHFRSMLVQTAKSAAE